MFPDRKHLRYISKWKKYSRHFQQINKALYMINIWLTLSLKLCIFFAHSAVFLDNGCVLPKFMFYLIATFPGLCALRGVPRDYVDLTKEKMEKKGISVEDVFKTKSLFGEDRREKLGDVFNPDGKGGRHFTKKEREFLMICARTPTKRKAPFSRRRTKVSTFDFV